MSVNEKKDRFTIGIHGLSEDIEDFIFEQDANNLTGFLGSFYKTCVDMLINGVDLSNKQLDIIYREYEKVKENRKTEVSRTKEE